MSRYTENDAAADTDAGGRETARAWHDARDAWRADGSPSDRGYYHTDEAEGFFASLFSQIFGSK